MTPTGQRERSDQRDNCTKASYYLNSDVLVDLRPESHRIHQQPSKESSNSQYHVVGQPNHIDQRQKASTIHPEIQKKQRMDELHLTQQD